MGCDRLGGMIRRCEAGDLQAMRAVINDAASAYKGVIPADCWHEPYMPEAELRGEIEDGVEFWGYEENGALVGVMGIQNRGEVTLIRHAYVRTDRRRKGIGAALLAHLERMAGRPILIGTWDDASWALRFYRKHGYRVLDKAESGRLLRKYWRIRDRQIETSVVLEKRE